MVTFSIDSMSCRRRTDVVVFAVLAIASVCAIAQGAVLFESTSLVAGVLCGIGVTFALLATATALGCMQWHEASAPVTEASVAA